ncbi:hypothetical protein HYT02_06000 [Candidatus Gottesmanbacteria bacterium]|nr:hypothetical protein [Candidatus Gottesmanbacteria bacterium]
MLKEAYRRVLEKHDYNQKEAADALGMLPTTLGEQLKYLGLR